MSVSRLPGTEDLDEPVAILPVIPSSIELHYSTAEKSYIYWAEKANEILNTLSSREKSKLIGPKKVDSLLRVTDLDYINSILDQSRTHTESLDSKRVRDMGEKLGVTKIIRLELEINEFLTSNETWSKGKKGDVYVTGHLFELSPPRLVKTYTVWAGYWRKTELLPIGCCILPGELSYKDKAWAIEEALEKSLSGLLFTSAQEPTFQ